MLTSLLARWGNQLLVATNRGPWIDEVFISSENGILADTVDDVNSGLEVGHD